MGLSNDLISQFVKVTKDSTNVKKESTVYGTTVSYNDKIYVKIDGSEMLTPIETTADVKPGERVMVMVKDHTATVTGNISSPSASSNDLKEVDGKVDKIGSKIAEFEIVVADKVSTKELEVERGRIDTLVSDNVTIKEKLTANEADIDTLKANDVTINGKLTANEADIAKVKTDKLDASIADITFAKVGDLNVTNATVNNLSAAYGDFKKLTTNRLDANEADIDDLQANKLSATEADLKYANIDFSNIGKAAIEEFYSKSGLIDDLVVGEGTITGTLVGVTIKGDLIEGGTVVADKLVVKGEDGLYYKLNTDGVTTEAEQTDYNSLNGSVITAKSITATKISVDDLVAFDATIGGFNITDNAIYSGAKSSINNTTRGIYQDKDGQFNVGDSSNYLKFYRDSNGSYKLAISAENIKFSASGKSVEEVLTETIDNIDVGGRNLYIINNSLEGYLDVNKTTLATMNGVRKEHTSEFIPVRSGEEFIFQVWVTFDPNDNDPYLWMAYDFFNTDKTPISDRPAKRINATLPNGKSYGIYYIKIPDGASYLRVSARFYTDGQVKLEKGNKPTDWSPAPEDMADTELVENTRSDITDSINSLSDNVDSVREDINESKDALNNALLIVEENKEQISSLIQEASGFTMNFKTLTETVSQLNGELQTEINERIKYIKFIDGTIWLGKEPELNEDDFKVSISNERMSFWQNDAEVAYLSNNKLYITNAQIIGKFRIGNFEFSTRNNGNMSICYVQND